MKALNTHSYKAVELLKSGKVGDSYSEKELSEVLGIVVAPGTEGKRRVAKAITIVYRDHKVLWAWFTDRENSVRTLRACTPSEAMKALESERRRLTRGAMRMQRKSLCLDESKLDSDDKSRYRAMQVQAVMTERTTKTTTLKKLIDNGHHLVAPDVPALIELMKR